MKEFQKRKGLSGLAGLTFGELKSSDKLINLLTQKVHELDPSRVENQVLEKRVRTLLELLRETLADRYQNLSIRAFAHILVALDYLLQVQDETPDTHEGGLNDDLQQLEEVFRNFKTEIEDFQNWYSRQQNSAAW
jgi:hypothetical protein